MKNIPVYRYPSCYALEHGEIEEYRKSMKANVACKEAIEKAIAEEYADNRLDTEATVAKVLAEHSLLRAIFVLANTVDIKSWDGRFSAENKRWAQDHPIHLDADSRRRFVVDAVHPGLTDLLVTAFRRLRLYAVSADNGKTWTDQHLTIAEAYESVNVHGYRCELQK